MENILSGIRILCVDDSSDSLELLCTILSRAGARVTSCDSAETAIACLLVQQFDVVVSDLSMPPGLDGYDLAHAIRRMEEENPARHLTPTIAVSGDAMRPSRKRRFADFQVYMPKPVDKMRLVYIVERLTEADGEVVRLGSLGIWEAEEATKAAMLSTEVAANSTAAAADATAAAVAATLAAASARCSASDAEMKASSASANAPSSR